jgi:SAM-dependent methyltransferase
MLTIAAEIYPQEYAQLRAIIVALEAGEMEAAIQLLLNAEKHLETVSFPPQKLQMGLFINAIRHRLNHTHAENLYLLSDTEQQIRMFNLMAEKFPVVRFAQDVTAQIFLARLAREKSVVILDIGMGTGQQVTRLIRQIHALYPQLTEISILGIEPSTHSIQQAKENFKALTDESPIAVSFTAITKTVEQLDEEEWQQLAAQIQKTTGPLLINASFALHHVQPVDFRTVLFQRLKSLNPAQLVIIEPYGDYTSPNLLTRFENAWHHYGLTFKAIDMIDAEESEKSAIKRIFFGREMVDVLAEGGRVEQFETAEMWSERCVNAGFQLCTTRGQLPKNFNPVVKVDQSKRYLGFNVNAHPIVAVICVD